MERMLHWQKIYTIPWVYGIFYLHEWLIFDGFHVGKYTIHGFCGIQLIKKVDGKYGHNTHFKNALSWLGSPTSWHQDLHVAHMEQRLCQHGNQAKHYWAFGVIIWWEYWRELKFLWIEEVWKRAWICCSCRCILYVIYIYIHFCYMHHLDSIRTQRLETPWLKFIPKAVYSQLLTEFPYQQTQKHLLQIAWVNSSPS